MSEVNNELKLKQLKDAATLDNPHLMLKTQLLQALGEPHRFYINGASGQGKTSLGFSLLDLHHFYHPERPCFMYRFPKPSILPSHIHPLYDLKTLPKHAVCYIDQASNDFDQFSYAKRMNVYVANLFNLARQKGQTLIMSDITSKRINRNLFYSIEIILLKEPSQFQLEEERPFIKRMYQAVNEKIKVNEFWWSDDQGVFAKGTFQKPSYYSEDFSHAWEDYEPQPINMMVQ